MSLDKHKYGVKMSGMPGNFEHSNIMLEARQIYQWTALSSIYHYSGIIHSSR